MYIVTSSTTQEVIDLGISYDSNNRTLTTDNGIRYTYPQSVANVFSVSDAEVPDFKSGDRYTYTPSEGFVKLEPIEDEIPSEVKDMVVDEVQQEVLNNVDN